MQVYIGDKVKWIDGMGFENHGIVYDCFSEDMVKIENKDGRIIRIRKDLLKIEVCGITEI
jgi:hypothetical protein